jgi:hypothetical protein
MSVKAGLTPNRAGRVTETAEFAAFARRIIRAYGRRIGQGGDIDALPELVALSAEIDAVISQSVTGLRAEGYSWGEIAARLGTSRQAAQQRFGKAVVRDGGH